MTDQDSELDKSEQLNRVRKELSALPRLKAPWYFEAKLRQRLVGERGRRRMSFLRPLPAYAYSAVGVAAAGIIVYFIVAGPGETTDVMPQQDVRTAQEKAEESPPSVEPVEAQKVLPDQELPQKSDLQQGPSAPQSEATIESGIDTLPGGERSAAEAQTIRLQDHDSVDAGLRDELKLPTPALELQKPVGTIRIEVDSPAQTITITDSTDSLRLRADSLRRE
jgi:hypothetical protein